MTLTAASPSGETGFLGVVMLGLLYSGCVIADISTFRQLQFIGGTIVLAAALDRFRHLRG